ncbi:MAG TPA: zinc ribbon domain-containing protein, partial [Streptomyces sp.]|uniref:zinc ribbon domain-containing protein n=1 Tax=Streptomyces sp. TaxID=1931 RepID=UPI002BDB7719
MRDCPMCGASNEATDDFCGNCGSYLGWSETGAARTERTPDGPEHPAAAGRPTQDPAAGTAAGSPPAPAAGTPDAVPSPSPGPATTPLPGTPGAGSGSGSGS